MSDKPLARYTLGELHQICKTVRCKSCPVVLAGIHRCPFRGFPNAWHLDIITEPERELLRLTGAKFISRNGGPTAATDVVVLWPARPELYEPVKKEGKIEWFNSTGEKIVGELSVSLFPSIPPGVCWAVAELLGEGEASDG